MKKASKFEEFRLFVLNDQRAPRLCPSLAVEIGLNESLIFLQIEFYLAVRGDVIDARKWIRVSLSDFEDEFPFMSGSTINRALRELERRRLIFVDNFNEERYDKTRWFSINMEAAAELDSISIKETVTKATTQNDRGKSRIVTKGTAQNDIGLGPGVTKGTAQNGTGSTQNGTRSNQNGTGHIRNIREMCVETKNETHTHSASGARECEQKVFRSYGSRYSLEECRQFADHLKASGEGITNPGGYATSIFRSGEADSLIETFLSAPSKPTVNDCPDCKGRGVLYIDLADPSLGVKKCNHERLTTER